MFETENVKNMVDEYKVIQDCIECLTKSKLIKMWYTIISFIFPPFILYLIDSALHYIAALFKFRVAQDYVEPQRVLVKQRLVFPLKDMPGSHRVSHRTRVVF